MKISEVVSFNAYVTADVRKHGMIICKCSSIETDKGRFELVHQT